MVPGTYEYEYTIQNAVVRAFWVISQAHREHGKLRKSVRSTIDANPKPSIALNQNKCQLFPEGQPRMRLHVRYGADTNEGYPCAETREKSDRKITLPIKVSPPI